jgi:hypothetical protein
MTVTRVTFGLFLGACALAGACDGETTGDEAGASAGAPASASAARDACALIDLEEIGAIAGSPLTGTHVVDSPSESSCELRNTAGGEPLIYVTVQWTGGKAQAEAQGAGMAMAKDLLNEPGIDIEELTGSGTEPGLADAAYYSNLMPSWVLKGDVLIEVMSPMFESDRTRRTFLAVAKTAISRL